MTNRQKIAAIGLAGLALALLVPTVGRQLLSSQPAEPTAAATRLPVDTMVVTSIDSIELPRVYTGVIRAGQNSELGFEIAGQLVSLAAREGDEVAAGDLLARLDTATLKAQRQVLEARREQAAAYLREMEAGPRVQTIDVARSQVEVAEAVASGARNTATRAQSLFQRNSIASEELDRAVFAAAAADAELAAARHKLAELEAGTRPEQIEAARGAVAQLDASLLEIDVNLAKSELRAPYDGTVIARFRDVGSIVSPGTPVLELQELNRLEAWVGLPADEAALLEPGAPSTLRVGGTAYQATLRTRIRQIDPDTRTQTAIFELDPAAADGLVAGQICKLELSVQMAERGIWVPTTALTQGVRGLWSVMVAEPSGGDWVTARRDVELVHADVDRSFVKGTLRDGDRLIVDGAHRLVVGQTVMPQPAAVASSTSTAR